MGTRLSRNLAEERIKIDEIISELKKDLSLDKRKAYLAKLSFAKDGPLLVKAANQWKISLIAIKEKLDKGLSTDFARSTLDDELKKSEETLALAREIPYLAKYIQEAGFAPETLSTKEQNQKIESVQKQASIQPTSFFQPKVFREIDPSNEEMANSKFGQAVPNKYNPFR